MDVSALLDVLPQPYTGIITAAIAVCAALTATIPPPANRASVWGRIYTALDFVALNIGHGKTASSIIPAMPAQPTLSPHA